MESDDNSCDDDNDGNVLDNDCDGNDYDHDDQDNSGDYNGNDLFNAIENKSNTSNQLIDQDPSSPRYPRRERRPPKPWYIASTVKGNSKIVVRTGDDPNLKEAMSATSEERALWDAAIQDELKSLDNKETWERDDNPKSQPLPTHIILKI